MTCWLPSWIDGWMDGCVMDQIQEFIYARVNALINEGITKCPPIQTALPSHVKGAPLTLSCSLSPRWGSKGVVDRVVSWWGTPGALDTMLAPAWTWRRSLGTRLVESAPRRVRRARGVYRFIEGHGGFSHIRQQFQSTFIQKISLSIHPSIHPSLSCSLSLALSLSFTFVIQYIVYI